jgi:hypothetical protein
MYSMTQKTVQLFRSANIARFNLHIKQSTKCETVAKIRMWPSYGVMNMCIIGIWRFRGSVANCDRWPTYKVEQLHTF